MLFTVPKFHIALDHGPLNFDCACYRVNDRFELQQQTVTHGLDNAPAMSGNGWTDQFGPVGPLRVRSTGLIGLHMARIGDNTRRDEGGQPAVIQTTHGMRLSGGRRGHQHC